MASSSTSFSATSGVHSAIRFENIGGTAREERNAPMKRFETVAVNEATRYELRLAIANGWKRIRLWYRTRQTYRELSRLDDRALRDIGIYRSNLRHHSRC
jgi:uncharacterized protein YjiS (DUF1127 family)